jgi:hypothetical protein
LRGAGGGSFRIAEVAQLVERNLAKVEVAGSSLVFRSKNSIGDNRWNFLFWGIFILRGGEMAFCPGGGTGRRAGLKILFPATEVRVRFPSRAHIP